MSNGAIHMFDILGVLLPIALVVLAYTRGVVMEILLFLAWSLGVTLAIWLFPHTQPLVAGVIKNAMLTDLLAVALVVVPLVLVARYGFQGVMEEINASRLGPMNRGLGVALGLVRGIMMAWLMVGLMSWSFMRSAAAAVYTQQTVTASSLKADLPIRDILCDKTKTKDWSLINQLDRRGDKLSALAREVVAFNKKPEDFPVMTFSRTLSAQLCGRR